MSEIKLASVAEMEGYDKIIKTYKYRTGTVIRILEKEGTKKRLFEYDATFSESIADTSITVIWTFDKNIFAVASDRNERFKFVESFFN